MNVEAPWRALLGSSAALAACLVAQPGVAQPAPPSFVVGNVHIQHYPADNDLMTAGLDWAGIASPTPPPTSSPPTPNELRRLSIYNSWRGLISTSPAQGYGSIYGRLGPVSGTEYLAFASVTLAPRASVGPTGPQTTLLAQIPDDFDTANPCIVTAPSSGSRGIYGAISNSEVAFAHKCAVAHTDKGTGVGFHDLTPDIAFTIRGLARPADDIRAHFEVPDSPALQDFKSQVPNRVAIKHAHSQDNPERGWGTFVLQSIEFTLWALNDKFGAGSKVFTKDNVLVIAAGVSNGGGAALRAAEQDAGGLIDGVVVSEPQVQPKPNRDFSILYRDRNFQRHSKSLYDVTTFMDVYADCAGLAPNVVTPSTPGAIRCQELKNRGLLNASTLQEQAQEARDRIHEFGLLEEQDGLLPSHASLHLWRILAPVYGNAYARAAVHDRLCKMSFAPVDASGLPTPWNDADRKKAFGTENGLPRASIALPPGSAPQIVDDESPPGSIHELRLPDLNLDGALCWRALLTGEALPTNRLPPETAHDAARQGIAEVRAGGDLRGKPTLILHGRKDALLPPNHHSRAYFGLNKIVEGRNNVRYIEVVHGNHFDAFIPIYPLLGVNETLVAMHGYFNDSVRQMLAHLRAGADLPASQVFTGQDETCPIPLVPAPENRIRFRQNAVIIPVGTGNCGGPT